MTVIDKKPVPLYEQKCPECGSTFIYKKSETYLNQLCCPVCGVLQWADFQMIEDERKEIDWAIQNSIRREEE